MKATIEDRRPQCGQLLFGESLKLSVGNVCANLDICCRQDKLEMVRASSASMSEVDPIDQIWIASLLSFAAGAAVIVYLEFSWGWAGYFAVPAGIAGFIFVPALWDLSLGFLERGRNY